MARRALASGADHIVAVDAHKRGKEVVPAPYDGKLTGDLEPGILVCGHPAARVGSRSTAGHTARYDCGTDSGIGRVTAGSARVFLNGRAAAGDGDPADTCALGGRHFTAPRVVVTQRRIWIA